MRGPRRLRSQLLLRVLAIITLLLLLLATAQYLLLGRFLRRQAEDGLHQQVGTALKNALTPEGRIEVPSLVRALAAPNTSIRLLDGEGSERAALGPAGSFLTPPETSGPAPAPGRTVPPRDGPPSRPDTQVQNVDGERWLVVAVPAEGGGQILVARSMREADASLRFLAWLTALGSAAGLGLAALTAWHQMGGSLRPLTRLVETAGAIAHGEWDRRVKTGGSQEIDEAATAFNRMVDRLQEAFAEEKKQQERMRQFLADAAHELRTPLTAVNGFVEIMQAGAIGEPGAQRRALGAMRSEGERMARLIRDLLQIARLDRPDHGGLAMADLELGQLLRSIQPALSAADPDHPIELQVDGPAPIRGNGDGLIQVIWNLVENGRRYSPPSRPIRITCRSEGEQVLLAVIDQGSGIAPEDLPHVFGRFWRGDASRQRQTGGTGLGLSIVQALIEAHGGQISLDSAPGTGTRVEVRLPRAGR